MTTIQAIILGIIQGITEFLPISSSGHLVLVPFLFGWEQHHPAFDIALHAGTLLAILIFYRKKIGKSIKFDEINSIEKIKSNIWFKLAITTIPAALIGIIFKDFIYAISGSIWFLALNLIFWGILFLGVERWFKYNAKDIKDVNEKGAFIIGLFQMLALLRGTSRSGATIIGGLTQKLDFREAVDFAFLAAIPVLTAAILLQIVSSDEILNSGIALNSYIIGTFTSFISGVITINILLKLIEKVGFKYFGIYRILLGIVILVISI